MTTSYSDYPSHLQGEAWLFHHNTGMWPSLPALLKHYGSPARVGRADVEKLDTQTLRRLYPVVVSDAVDAQTLDANYARHCRLSKLIGQEAVEMLALGHDVSETARRCGINRKTIQRAFALIRSEA